MHADIETKCFQSWEAFTAWKETEEESSFTHFVQPNGGKTRKSDSLGISHSYHTYLVWSYAFITWQSARAFCMSAVMMENNIETCSHAKQLKREILLRVLGNFSSHIVWQECMSNISLILHHHLLKLHTYQLIPIILLGLKGASIFLYPCLFVKRSGKNFLKE